MPVTYMGPPVKVGGGSSPSTNRGPANGRIRTVRGYGPWLYAGLYTGSQSWLLAGQGNIGNMVWHTLQRFPHQTKISRLHIDGITAASGGVRIPNRMWALTDASIDTGGTAPIYFWPIPTLDGNPLAPSPAFSTNYIGSARMDLGSVDWGAPSTPKFYRSVEIWADSLLSGYRYGDIYYDVDQSGSFSLLGRAQTSPKTILYFPEHAEPANLITNGTFDTSIAGWSDASTVGGELGIYWLAGKMELNVEIGETSRARQSIPTFIGRLYRLNFTTQDGTMTYSIGTTAGGAEIATGSAGPGASGNIDFTATTTTTWLEISKDVAGVWRLDDVTIAPLSLIGVGYVTGQSIELSLRSFTASPALTPVYRAVVLRGALRPNSIDEITAVVRIGDEIRDRQGAAMRSGAVMLQELRDMAEQNNPVKMLDISGAAHYVSVLAPVEEQETYQLGEQEPEIAATVKFAVMTFS